MLDEEARRLEAQDILNEGRVIKASERPDNALPLFLKAWELARDGGCPDIAADALHMLAIVAPLPAAEHWTAMGLEYVDAHPGQAFWRGPLHHNLGWHYFDAQRFNEALACFRDSLRVRVGGNSAQVRIARYCVIRALRALNRVEEAADFGEVVAELADAKKEEAPFIYEELAECYASSRPSRSQKYAIRALATLAEDNAFSKEEPRRLARLHHLANSH